jgi:hypothetical protein
MRLPNALTDEQSRALVECLRILARHGRALRLQREREQKAKSAGNLGRDAADLASDSTTHKRTVVYGKE